MNLMRPGNLSTMRLLNDVSTSSQLPNEIDLTNAPELLRPLPRAKNRGCDLAFVPPNVIRALCARIPKGELVKPDEITTLLKISASYDQAHQFLIANLDVNARQEWKNQAKLISNLVMNGESAKAQKIDVPEKAKFLEQALLKRKAIKKTLRELRDAVQPIQIAVANRIANVARALAVEEEAIEIERATKWGFEFFHSRLIHLLDLLARRPEVIATMTGHPKTCLAFTYADGLSDLESQLAAAHPQKKAA